MNQNKDNQINEGKVIAPKVPMPPPPPKPEQGNNK